MEKTITLTRGITAFPHSVIVPIDSKALALLVKLVNIDVDVAAAFKWSNDGVDANAVALVDAAGDDVTMTVATATGEAGILLQDLIAPYVHITFSITGVTAPTVASEAESDIDQMNATIGANITTNGGETDVFVEYGLTDEYGRSVECDESPLDDDESAQAVTASLTGLVQGSTYHYRIKAVNAKGTTYGNDQSFDASDAEAPTIASKAESGITQLAAAIAANVTPNGAATTVSLQYGTTTSYGTTVQLGTLAAGLDAVEVTAALSGLTPNTTYHYRIVAVNSAGTTNGTDQSFATLAVAAPTVASPGSGFKDADEVRLGATITPNGAATTVTLQIGTTTSYGTNVPIEGGVLAAGTAAVKVLAKVFGLAASTTYHYRFVAVNSAGTTNGSDATFATTA